MKVGIIGNRTGFIYKKVRKVLLGLGVTKNDTIISGGAIGVDTYAQEFAKEIGARILIIYPDPKTLSPERYWNRNKVIVDLSDYIIAFNKMHNGGTVIAINYAKKKEKKIIITGNQKRFGGI